MTMCWWSCDIRPTGSSRQCTVFGSADVLGLKSCVMSLCVVAIVPSSWLITRTYVTLFWRAMAVVFFFQPASATVERFFAHRHSIVGSSCCSGPNIALKSALLKGEGKPRKQQTPNTKICINCIYRWHLHCHKMCTFSLVQILKCSVMSPFSPARCLRVQWTWTCAQMSLTPSPRQARRTPCASSHQSRNISSEEKIKKSSMGESGFRHASFHWMHPNILNQINLSILRWCEQLIVYPRTNKQNQKKKRKVEPTTSQVVFLIK